MKRDVVFMSSKRFKFVKIEESDFRLDSHQNDRSQRLKISDLNLICVRMSRRTKTYQYFFLKDKVLTIYNRLELDLSAI